MIGGKTIAAAILALAAVPVAVSAQAARDQAAPDPVRLDAARVLVEQMFPPAAREQMVHVMLAPMVANVRQGLTQTPQFARAMEADPRAKAIIERYLDKQMTRSMEVLQKELPGMVEAMSRAYARRFDAKQLGELSAFFATPTGRAYVGQSMTIMSDPDIAAWQRKLMTETMSYAQDDIAAMVKEIATLEPQDKKQ
ncbi:MAG: DUF2059 domain-containing protein [Sphingomonas sp.]|nr:DUF2059 domain-containing protein [Sphingomonas sp.]